MYKKKEKTGVFSLSINFLKICDYLYILSTAFTTLVAVIYSGVSISGRSAEGQVKLRIA